ncbi:uncharacterized protein [Physcomitrium patens]|nr:spermatogenesis-associated protein 20-like isoform X2 [Physcomitrium patens]|eukprot:XP_024370757.1 spermatogenesis-associated protein 20-like isoform X2 [Physcomitrella patens]
MAGGIDVDGGSTSHKHTNRLAKEHSPYLLQHAHNPVDWYPWGEEAFAKAREEDKPIFLSVGYSTCHWCHVMEVESFENEEIAKLQNEWFVNIKVDREERPDVDKVYMTYVQASQGGGGWPMSVFLTPELKPIVGGTYFPPDDKYGRPGFKTVLKRVREVWESKKDVLRESGKQVVQQLAEATAAVAPSTELTESSVPAQAVTLCANQLSKGFDSKLGGFGGAPKFPRPVEVALMMRNYKRLEQQGKEQYATKALEMALFSLQCMANGGMHDHVGGGFHRYSVDEYWHVPHFEKMLYDNAQLVNVYLDAFAVSKDLTYSYVARDVLDYLIRDMTHPEGGIYSAEDADSAETTSSTKKKEGLFYIWTLQEIEEVLGKEQAQMFIAYYYVKAEGNCDLSRMSDPHGEFGGKNVLIKRSNVDIATKFGKMPEDVSQYLGQCRAKLHAYRSQRPHPHLDDKVIVAWNGLAISAFARASRILLNEPSGVRYEFPVTGCHPKEYLVVAERAAHFIKSKLYNEKTKRLTRSYRNGPSKAPGFLDDYAFLIAGLLDLFECGGDYKWLQWALELQSSQDEQFLDKEGGAYYITPEGDPSILFRMKEDYDGAEPSGNSVAAINLLRLSSLVTGDLAESVHTTAEHLLAVYEQRVKEVAMAVPLLCCAFDSFSVAAKRQIIIAGVRNSPDTDALMTACHAPFDPDRNVILIDESNPEERDFWQSVNSTALAMARKAQDGRALAYVCQNFTCQAPTGDHVALEQLLRQTFTGPKIYSFKAGLVSK